MFVTLRAAFLVLLINTYCSGALIFEETFESPGIFESGKWVKSKDAKYVNQPIMIKTAKSPVGGFEEDKGLQLTQEMAYYGVAAKFSELFVPAQHKEIVIQYEVKLEEGLNCGGAYLKLPRSSDEKTTDELISNLNNETPYSIMFGPDKCGSSNKVHFILQYQNPLTKEWEEKHLNQTIPIKNDKKIHLYTLIIKSDNSFEILVDMSSALKGSLLTHLNPPINPPEFIDDSTDVKPDNWVDLKEIDDPSASKPDDWDESQPRKIVNEVAVKPEGWLDYAPLQISDPKAVKPEDWDDEEDGVWEAPQVDNPACEKVGCGVWTAPMINNPLYKGKWIAPKIANPEYKGPWSPRQAANPSHFIESDPFAHIAAMEGVAIEVWTTSAGIHFDNIIVSDSVSEAIQFSSIHTKPKTDAEIAQHKEAEKLIRDRDRREAAEKGGLKGYIEVRVMELVEYFNENPATLAISVAAVVIPFFYLILFGGKSATELENDEDRQKAGVAPAAATEPAEEKQE